MADQYYKTFGQAWQAIADTFSAYGQLAYYALGFAVSWHPGSTVNGGYWEVEGDAIVGEAYANGKYWAAEAKTGAGLPIGRVLTEDGAGSAPKVEPMPDTGALTANQLLVALKGARAAALSDVTDASGLDEVELPSILAGASDAVVERAIRPWVNQIDQVVDIVSVVVSSQLPTTSAMTQPINPQMSSNTQQTVNNVINTAAAFDVTSTLNPGGSVVSVVSRQVLSE